MGSLSCSVFNFGRISTSTSRFSTKIALKSRWRKGSVFSTIVSFCGGISVFNKISTLHVCFAYHRTLQNQQRWEHWIHVIVCKIPANGHFPTAAITSRLAMFRLYGFWRTVSVKSWYIRGAVQRFGGLKMICFTEWTFSFREVYFCLWFIELYYCYLLNRSLEIPNHGFNINLNPFATVLCCFLLLTVSLHSLQSYAVYINYNC